MRAFVVCVWLASCGGSSGPVPQLQIPDWVEELPAEAQPVVADSYSTIMACGAEVGGDPVGEVSIVLGIGNGKVKTFGLATNTTGRRDLVECVQGKARKMRFAKGYRTDLRLRYEFGGE